MCGLHAHADAIYAHLFKGSDFFRLPIGNDGRCFDADYHACFKAKGGPRGIDHPLNVGRLGKSRRPAADVEADEGFVCSIHPLTLKLELA